MSLSKTQYTEIMDSYSRLRRENKLAEHRRREEVYEALPRIRDIDQEIAHISLDAARYMVLHPGEDRRQDLHDRVYALSMEKVDLLATHGYPPNYLDPVFQCPDCQDTGYIGNRPCSCFQRHVSRILYDQSNLKEISPRESFASFRLDYYSEEVPEGQKLSPRANMTRILEQTRDFIRSFDKKPGQNLLIRGRAGVGKTFLSHCIATELLDLGKKVIYMTSYDFFHQLGKYTFRRDQDQEEAKKVADMLDCDLLIIDDLGTEMNNSFVNSRLFLCVNERMIRKKSTIINTNLSLKQISQTYSERISSRIIESYLIIHIYGEDIRVKKAFSYLD